MIQINVSEKELSELQAFYTQEYDKTLKRLEDLKGILNKLGHAPAKGNAKTTKLRVKTHSRVARKRGHNAATQGISRKLGTWPTFLIDTIKAKGKAIKTADLYNIAVKHFNANTAKEQKSTFSNLRGHLYRMTNNGLLTKRKGKGTRDVFYNLA